MILSKEEHRSFLLELLTNPGISVPLPAADMVIEIREAVRNARVDASFARVLTVEDEPDA